MIIGNNQIKILLPAIFVLLFNVYSIPQSVVINEINYNSSAEFNPEDWLELINYTDSTVDISNWVFKDEEDIHGFVIPSGTLLNSREFIVLVRDTALFKPLFPFVNNYIGNIGFGLSGGGELLRLYDNNMVLIDSLTYDDQAPWPVEADGLGPTLSLINPDLDNSLPDSWGVSIGHGTPGTINDNFTFMDDYERIIPGKLILEQNYPNPFNPVTKISWQSPTGSHQTLKIYDVLGTEVAALVNEYKPAGNHEIQFDASRLSTGIYFYQLSAGEFVETKKLVLLR